LAGRAAPGGDSPRFPHRVVALAPNLTEIVFALGAGNRLVGVSQGSDYPPEARRIPRIGGLTPDLERIVALRPDLVVATTEGNPEWAVDRLRGLRIPVLVTSGRSLPEVFEAILSVGSALGKSARAKSLVGSLRRRRDFVLEQARTHRPRPALFLVWPDPPQVAGGGSFGDRLIADAGGRNLAAGLPGWPVVSREFLLKMPADAVVVYPDEADTRARFAAALAVPGPLFPFATRAPRCVGVEASLLERPGPRSLDALERLERIFAGTP
jgi:ABC-type hemin transport system substrate-binding protein